MPEKIPVPAEAAEKEAQAVSGFVIGPGDELKISVWKNQDLDRTLRVDPLGDIFFPLAGKIHAEGMGTEDLREKITAKLGRYISNPQVNVEVVNFRSRKIYITGEVQRPGRLVIEDSLNIMDAVSISGGFTNDADKKKVILIRPSDAVLEISTFNVENLLEEGDLTQMVSLKKGDMIYVPPTKIANLARYCDNLARILAPVLNFERAVVLGDEIYKIINGTRDNTTVIVR